MVGVISRPGGSLTPMAEWLLPAGRAVDPAPDPAVPRPTTGQPADAVPAGPAGGAMAAAQADRPRRPAHDHVVAGIVARLIDLPRRAVVLAEDETHLNLLPHVRPAGRYASLGRRFPTPGTNRQVTVFGALEVTTGAWVYRLGKRCAADFIALLDQVLAAFPAAPAIVMICDNDSIHHARKVSAYLEKHPRLELLYGARYSPHDNPVERIWGALKNYVANTAVTWPGRLRQIHSFFRNRSPGQMLDTAAPWTSPWLPPGYAQNLWNGA